MPPIVALLTDFGLRDPYVGATRGAVLCACPTATLVDIAHELPAHEIEEGAFSLVSAYRAFPAGTVFLAVVDPGVGSQRRGIAVEAAGYRFVGPDNGIFSLVLDEVEGARVHEITNAGLFRHEVSPTFHARDVFGPVAGLLAAGMPLEEVGPSVADPVRFASPGVEQVADEEWAGQVVHTDRFGNLTTNMTQAAMKPALDRVDRDPTQLVVVVEGAVLPLVRTYAEVAEGEACALIGSSGRLEIAANRGSASRLLGATRGAPVRLRVVSMTGPPV